MYKPKFNSLLVEIDDKDAKWGKGNDDSMLGASYREGKLMHIGHIFPTKDYPSIASAESLKASVGRAIMWNEGVEAGTVFEHEGKQYAFIYWWDVRGVKE